PVAPTLNQRFTATTAVAFFCWVRIGCGDARERGGGGAQFVSTAPFHHSTIVITAPDGEVSCETASLNGIRRRADPPSGAKERRTVPRPLLQVTAIPSRFV